MRASRARSTCGVVSATNRDLQAEVEAKRFREDLLFRLNVVALEIPPLRERIEDVPQLVGRFLRHFAEAHDRRGVHGVTRAAMDLLLTYSWPGNVRELVNVIERGVPPGPGQGAGGRATCPTGYDTRPPTPPEGHGEERDDALFDLPLREAKQRVVEDFERRYLRAASEARVRRGRRSRAPGRPSTPARSTRRCASTTCARRTFQASADHD